MYSIEEQYHMMSHLINHENDHVITALTNMIDQAGNHVIMCRDYLTHHPVEEELSAMHFLDDALKAL